MDRFLSLLDFKLLHHLLVRRVQRFILTGLAAGGLALRSLGIAPADAIRGRLRPGADVVPLRSFSTFARVGTVVERGGVMAIT